jgi:hypothetical protein
MTVRSLSLNYLEALFVLLGLVVNVDGLLRNEVTSTGDAVELTETRFIFLLFLMQKLLSHLWEQILIYNLIEVTLVTTLGLISIDSLVLTQ